MPDGAPLTRIYVQVLIVQAVILLGLWLLERIYV
jgi:hypothetical protein